MDHISYQLDTKVKKVKIRLRNTCKKYFHVRLSHQYRSVVEKITKTKDIIISKHGEGRCCNYG